MDGAVVQIADGREVTQLVTAAATAIFDVVQVQPDVPAAPGHRAAMAVSREHLLALAGGDSLGQLIIFDHTNPPM
jgi:hypothetical protein